MNLSCWLWGHDWRLFDEPYTIFENPMKNNGEWVMKGYYTKFCGRDCSKMK